MLSMACGIRRQGGGVARIAFKAATVSGSARISLARLEAPLASRHGSRPFWTQVYRVGCGIPISSASSRIVHSFGRRSILDGRRRYLTVSAPDLMSR